VYEPLPAFGDERADRLRKLLEAGSLPRSAAGDRERELWLRSQLVTPPRLLPGERADGSRVATSPRDVLVVDPADVPTDPAGSVGPGPLICPLDLRVRSAAALGGFVTMAPSVLRTAALDEPPETVKTRVTSVMSESGGTVHVVSATWTVPLPWFVLVDPEQRQVVLAKRDDGERRVSWLVAMATARRRLARAYSIVKGTLGDAGPATVLADTGRWLETFHPHSAVELDYGGLVQLLDDEMVLADTSAADVHAIVDALEAGDSEEVATRYERLREFWDELADHERFG